MNNSPVIALKVMSNLTKALMMRRRRRTRRRITKRQRKRMRMKRKRMLSMVKLCTKSH